MNVQDLQRLKVDAAPAAEAEATSVAAEAVAAEATSIVAEAVVAEESEFTSCAVN